MAKTKIEWCDITVNPVVGCSTGCEYCYARNMNNRFKWIDDFSIPQFFPERLEMLEKIKRKVIFLNSMSDIDYWNFDWLKQTLDLCENNKSNIYLILTKSWTGFYCMWPYGKNIRIGRTINSQVDFEPWVSEHVDYDFISIEPIHEHIKLPGNLNVKWIIVGAETGNRKDKIIPDKFWIEHLVEQCKKRKIPLFMKNSLVKIIGEENMIREYPNFILKIEGKRKYVS